MDLTFGIDLSLWQHNKGYAPQQYFDPFVAKQRGVQFAFIKASERTGKDPAVEVFQDTFKQAGIPRGFYHFARYSQMSGVSAKDQARFFWNIIKDYDAELPPVLDLEDRTLINGNGIGMSWIQSFLYELRDLCGKNPIIYTAAGWYNAISKSNETVSNWIKVFPLWIANYLPNSEQLPQYNHFEDSETFIASQITDNRPAIPAIFKDPGWRFWQYSQIGDGYYYGGKFDFPSITGLDMNVYYGTLFDLFAEFGVYEVEPPIEPPAIEPPVIEINTHVRVISRQANGNPGWLFFRDGPEFYPGEVLAVGYDTLLELLDPEPINGLWHVKTPRGWEGYVSAGSAYTELV